MNDYERRQEERRERLQGRAAKARDEAERRLDAARRTADAIPLGQPILVGHHSEKRHRRDVERIHTNTAKGVEAAKLADELERRADAVGTGGISSDDPEAVTKLRAELEDAKRHHELAKRANVAWRKFRDDPAKLHANLISIGFTEKEIASQVHTMKICSHLDAPFHLQNSSANVRRIEGRIAELEKGAPTMETIEGPGYTIEARADINRVALTCAQRVPTESYRFLKSHGWRWSPSEGAFLRHLNNAGIYAAKLADEHLRKALAPTET